MSRIFYLMGKSASGKDSVYRGLMKRFSFEKIVRPELTEDFPMSSWNNALEKLKHISII